MTADISISGARRPPYKQKSGVPASTSKAKTARMQDVTATTGMMVHAGRGKYVIFEGRPLSDRLLSYGEAKAFVASRGKAHG